MFQWLGSTVRIKGDVPVGTKLFSVVLMILGLLCAPLMTESARAATCRSLQAVKLSDSVVTGGQSLTGTVVMTCRINRSANVQLGAFPGVRTPDSVTVPAGARSKNFTIRTSTTSLAREGNIKATFRTTRRIAALKVLPPCRPRVSALELPTDLHAGESARGRVTLSCTPASSTSVALASNHPNASVPDSMSVPAGRRSSTFRVNAASTHGSSYVAHVTAKRGSSAVTRELTVTPGLKFVEIPASSQRNSVGLSVLFTGSLPAGGATVTLSSNSPAVTVPSTYKFPSGSLGGGVSGIDVQTVSEDTNVTISVTYGRRTMTASKTLIAPADPTAPNATLSRLEEGEYVYGGQSFVQYDVHLDAPAPEGGLAVTFRIRGNDPAASVESTGGHISEGSTSTSTNVTFADVTTTHTVVLEAVIGETVAELPITIQPRVTDIVVPLTITGGQSFSGTVNLAGPASVDTVVYLGSSWGIVEVQPSLTIPPGQTSATFTATTSVVSEDSLVFIDGSYGDQGVQSNPIMLTP